MKTILVILTLLTAVGCNSKLEDPESVPPAEVLLLQTGKKELLYATLDTTTVTARIPKEAGTMDVKFTATHGTFVASSSKTVSQYADSIAGNYRYAVVLFTSDSSLTTVYVTAEINSVRERTTLKFTK